MAIGTVTINKQRGADGKPVPFFDHITFTGEASYPTGGMTGLQAALRTAVGDSRTILGVIPQRASGHQVEWDRANGKLLVYQGNFDYAGDGPGIEVVNGENLAGVTFELLVISY